jgi:hypothetical protein
MVLFLQVAPPILHIMLGLFQKLYDLMEGELHLLDLQLLREKATTLGDNNAARTLFEKYEFQCINND